MKQEQMDRRWTESGQKTLSHTYRSLLAEVTPASALSEGLDDSLLGVLTVMTHLALFVVKLQG